MDAKMLEKINAAYARLESKQTEFIGSLSRKGYEVKSGWYNGYEHREDGARMVRESYPIPVISVNDSYNIEIQFDKISISTAANPESVQARLFEAFNEPELLKEMNTAYARLESKQTSLVQALSGGAFEVESGWYNGHYHREDEDRFVRESYPIPVISLKGFCDIEIRFDKISVSAKMQRDAAQAYSFEKFAGYEFEAYGAEDYLADFYHAGQSIHEMQNSIRACREKEIGFSFMFQFETDGKQLLEFVNLLCQEGFYD